LVKWLKDAGANALTLIPLRPAGNAVEEFYKNKLTPTEYKNVIERVNGIREEHKDFSVATCYDILSTASNSDNVPSYWSKMCMAGIEAACISPAGNLRACILHQGDKYNVGNLKTSSLGELWHDDSLWGIFRDMNKRVLDQCKDCKDYTIKCAGSCLAMVEFTRSTEEIYCFKHLNNKIA